MIKFNREKFLEFAKKYALEEGYHPSQISLWGKGVNPSVETMERILTKAGCTKEDILEVWYVKTD